jgi:hypothetical protein
MYKQIRALDGSISTNAIQRMDDMALIPCTEENADYRKYLEWEAIEGNDILAPEE